MSRSETDADSRKQRFRDLLGYLNFSDGSPGSRFRICLNELFAEMDSPWKFDGIRTYLLKELADLSASGEGAFEQTDQADHAVRTTFDVVLPAYLKHHEDLLFHLDPAELCQPFLLAKVFEATLAAATAAGIGAIGWATAISSTAPRRSCAILPMFRIIVISRWTSCATVRTARRSCCPRFFTIIQASR